MRLFNRSKNAQFLEENPGVVLPPDYLMYESFQLDYRKYFKGGSEDAMEMAYLIKSNVTHTPYSVLDWGCGPARIIRHLPAILGEANSYFGTDYNPETISWCSEHIKGVSFSKNELSPPLNYAKNHFNFIYGISIFTHLSKANHSLWAQELFRVLKEEGVLYFTTHGDAFLEKLIEQEREKYARNELVERANVVEGHRVYAAFQPPQFINNVLEEAGFIVISHLPGKRVNESYISQDQWVVKKGRF